MIRPLLVSESDTQGGAARAAYRLHRALLANDVRSRMLVQRKLSDDWSVSGPTTHTARALAMLRPSIGTLISNLQQSSNPILHSPAILPSTLVGRINRSDADVIHLHWVFGEMLSIGDIGRIRKPIVWTLHDTWPFCGTEHYPVPADKRYQTGYTRHNRPTGERGLDLDRRAWRRKRSAWKIPMTIVCPSHWMADRVRESALMAGWPVHVIPNPLDTDAFKPIDKTLSRRILNLPADRPILLFGAIGGGKDPRKGFDLLQAALHHLKMLDPRDFLCAVFGQLSPKTPPPIPFETRWFGHLHDDPSLALLYNAADVLILPSRQENLPQTGTEAQACGCPVVAFDTTGLPDVVAHRQTGYLATSYDPASLSHGIRWLLGDDDRYKKLQSTARKRAINLWNPSPIIRRYLDIYSSLSVSV